MTIIISKVLTKTDIDKRFSIHTKKKECFVDFGSEYKVVVEVIDDNGKVWSFECSKRKTGKFPKPIFGKGWLGFVREWKLAVGDVVVLFMERDEAGKCCIRITVKRTAKQKQPLVQNYVADASMTMEAANSGNLEEELSPTIIFDGTESEGAHNQPVTNANMVALMYPHPHVQARGGEPILIDFFEREKERASWTTSLSLTL